VHSGVKKEVVRTHKAFVDRSVKPTVSQLLLGTNKPAALIELGFVSNTDEARLLVDTAYQRSLAQGICTGIMSYFEQFTQSKHA
jgi:N-acetylmuramoyl-L-alanine amidase